MMFFDTPLTNRYFLSNLFVSARRGGYTMSLGNVTSGRWQAKLVGPTATLAAIGYRNGRQAIRALEDLTPEPIAELFRVAGMPK